MNAVVKEPWPRLRPMGSRDLGAIGTIECAAYTHPWSPRIFSDCLRVGYSCWVLELEGVVQGYGIMSVGAGECHILNLCVRPASQQRGFGRMLLAHLLDSAQEHGAERALLEVRPSNGAARRLYRQMGFAQVGVRRAYYPTRDGREDALVLTRPLAYERVTHGE